MIKYRLLSLLLVFVLLAQIAHCQRFTLDGRVFDAVSKAPVQNATVFVRVLDIHNGKWF